MNTIAPSEGRTHDAPNHGEDQPLIDRYGHMSILHLPDELLALIFDALRWLWFCDGTAQYDRGAFTRGGYPCAGWISEVTHVCRRWREVALSEAHLWSNLCLSNLACAREMIHRAASAPLTVVYGDQRRGMFGNSNKWDLEGDVLRIVLDHLPRIRVLDIEQLEQDQVDDMLLELLQAAPILETLTLATGEHPVVVLPSGIFAGHVPRLRKLQAVGCKLEMPLACFANLTHLSFINSGERGSQQLLTVSQTLEILEVATGLQDLRMKDCLLHSPNSARVVKSSSLVKFVLEGQNRICYQLLAALILPSAPSLTLVCEAPFGSEEDLLLAEYAGRHLAARGSSDLTVSMTVYAEYLIWLEYETKLRVCGPNDTFKISAKTETSKVWTLLSALFRSLSPLAISTFIINPRHLPHYWDGPEWLQSVRNMSQLRTITVHHTQLAKTLLGVLARDHTTYMSNPVLFPFLRRLVLSAVDIMEINHLLQPALQPKVDAAAGDEQFDLHLIGCHNCPQAGNVLVPSGVLVEYN